MSVPLCGCCFDVVSIHQPERDARKIYKNSELFLTGLARRIDERANSTVATWQSRKINIH